MSVSILNTPQAYTPAYNGQFFTASSNQTAQPNFTYTIKVYDLITYPTSDVQVYEVEPRPDGKVVFDASVFSKNFIKDFIPNNEYGWQVCTDAIRKVRVNIGETYGSTPAYASGVNNDFIIWNGYVRYLEWPTYDDEDYVYSQSDTRPRYLTELFTKQTYSDKSLFLYALTSEAGDLQTLRVNTFDANGTQIGTSDIDNPYEALTTYTSKYLCIDVGKKGLDGLGSIQVSGTYPVLPANAAYYTLQDVTVMWAPPSTVITDLFRVDIICEPRHDVYCVHFKDKSGNFETCLFPKVSEINIDAEKKYFRKNPFELVSDEWTYDTFTSQEELYSSQARRRLRLTTDWLSDDQVENYQNIINGKAYLDMGSTTGLIPIKVMTGSYKLNKKWNERLYSMQIDIEYTFKELYL